MNIVGYNLIKFQNDYKLSNKKLAFMLGCTVKQLKQMHKESYQFNDQEIEKISEVMLISKEELTTEMNERINLKERKIYGTNYLYVNYKVLDYKIHNVNLISAIIDFVFFVVFTIFALTGIVSLGETSSSFQEVLKMTIFIELFVFPFMFIALPLLKIYFNRTYKAVLTSDIKEYYQEEACGIILSCLRRSINKSVVPYFFTLFSETVIALYCLLEVLSNNQNIIGSIIVIVLYLISLIVSVYSFKYHFSKYGNVIIKE